MFDFTSSIVDKAKTFEYDAIYKNDNSLWQNVPFVKKGKVYRFLGLQM